MQELDVWAVINVKRMIQMDMSKKDPDPWYRVRAKGKEKTK